MPGSDLHILYIKVALSEFWYDILSKVYCNEVLSSHLYDLSINIVRD